LLIWMVLRSESLGNRRAMAERVVLVGRFRPAMHAAEQ
jgi:hypothetical protein